MYMAHIEVIETSQGRPNTEETNAQDEDVNRSLRFWTVFVCITHFAYIVAIAVLVGILRGWGYSVHCFLLCVLILVSFVLTLKAKKKLLLKKICLGSCTTLVVVLMTTFTLLTRQAYYHPSSHIPPKWILFCLQASIIPLVVSLLVMYEFRIRRLYKDSFILMIAILDFGDTWAMSSILDQHKEPFIKEKSPLEITVQFFCSFSFIIFPVLIYKNIPQSNINNEDPPTASAQDRNDQGQVKKLLKSVYTKSNSQLNQNIPFLVIRVLLWEWYSFVDFDYMAKNVISVALWFLDFFQSCMRQIESDS